MATPSTERLNINGLLPETDYIVQVRAVNDAGHSKWSQKFTFKTIDDTINGRKPKTILDATWTYDTQGFHATWGEIDQNTDNSRAKIERYDVELTHAGVTKIAKQLPEVGTVTYDLPLQRAQALFNVKAIGNVSMRVRAVNASGNKGAWSASLAATAAAPSAPTSGTVEETTDGLKISWTPPASTANLAGYHVYISTSGAGFTPTDANRVYEGAAPTFMYNTATYLTHYIKVRSYNAWGAESADLSLSGTPKSPFTVDVAPPNVPSITTGSSYLTNNANGIGAYAVLVWTQTVPTPDDLAAFDIRYRKVGDTAWTNTGRVDKADRSAIIPVPEASTNYEFQIRSLDYSANPSAWSTTATLNGQANQPPASVASMNATAGNDSITYSWSPVPDSDLKTYEVTFSTSPTFASGNTTFYSGTAPTLTVGGLTYATTYYARVRAVDNGGLTSGSWSATKTASTSGVFVTDGLVPAVPSAPTVMPGPAGSLYAVWSPVTTNSSGSASSDTVTYEVHLSATSGFSPAAGTKVTEVTGTSVLIDSLPGTTTPLTYDTTYYVKLVAKDRDGTQTTASAQGSAAPSKIASGDVTSIGADLIVPGTGFVSALQVSSGGSIQSSNYNPSTPAGWKLSTGGAEFLDSGSTIRAEAIKAGTLGGASGSGVINIAAGTSLIFNGGYLKSNTYTGTSQASNPSGAGFYLGNDGIRIDQGIVSASALTTGTISGTSTITLSGANAKIVGPGFSLSGSGLSVTSGYIDAAVLSITNSFANSVVASTTVIDGGKINTGTIQSNQYTSVGGTTQPLWVIAVNGAATFSDASVRGKLVVGPAGSTDSSWIQSGNYVAGTQGWKIDATGAANFMQANIIGTTKTGTGTDYVQMSSDSVYVYGNSSLVGSLKVYSMPAYVGGGKSIGLFNAAGSNGIFFNSSGTQIAGTMYWSSSVSSMAVYMHNISSSATLYLSGQSGINLDGGGYGITVPSGGASISGGGSWGGSPTFGAGFTSNGSTTFNGTVNDFPNAPTVAGGSANVNFNTGSTNRIRLITASAKKYKKNIYPLTDLLDAETIVALEPKRFQYKESVTEDQFEVYGFIADEADAGGLGNFVDYLEGHEGEVENFNYARFSAAQQVVLRNHHGRVKELEDEVAELKAMVKTLMERS